MSLRVACLLPFPSQSLFPIFPPMSLSRKCRRDHHHRLPREGPSPARREKMKEKGRIFLLPSLPSFLSVAGLPFRPPLPLPALL